MSERPRKIDMKLPHPGDFIQTEILDGEHRYAQACADPKGVLRVLRPTVVAGVSFLVGRDAAMGWPVRRWEQSNEGLGQVMLGMWQEPRARRGRRQVAVGGSRGCVPEQTPY